MQPRDHKSVTHDVLAGRFRWFAATECAGRSPLYERLSLGVADDPALLGLFAGLPEVQRRQPWLLLYAVHDVVLRGDGGRLARWYPSVCPKPTVDADPFPQFRRLCLERAEEIRGILAARTAQTNEVARSAVLAPAIAALAERHGRLAVIEVGASAGLNLHFDRYAYHYHSPTGSTASFGDQTSPMIIDVVMRGDTLPPVTSMLPTAQYKVGLDANPIDVADPEQTRWLQACIWPDQPERMTRLRRALTIAQTHPARLVQGDAIDDLPALVATVPVGLHLCIFHSWTIGYLDEKRQKEFAQQLAELAMARPISWLALERPADTPGLPTPPRQAGPHAPEALALTLNEPATTRQTRLADAHPHLAWLQWHTQPSD